MKCLEREIRRLDYREIGPHSIASRVPGEENGILRTGSGASAVTQNDQILVAVINNLTRARDPIAPLTTGRGAVGRRQMRTAVC